MKTIRDTFSTLSRNWQRSHAILAPFGTGLSTLILSIYAGNGRWEFWQSWHPLAEMASLGVIIYGITIILLEGGATLVFWAWNEHNKREERRKRQQTAEILDQVKEALLQNPDSDPVLVVEQMSDRVRNGQPGER